MHNTRTSRPMRIKQLSLRTLCIAVCSITCISALLCALMHYTLCSHAALLCELRKFIQVVPTGRKGREPINQLMALYVALCFWTFYAKATRFEKVTSTV
jgi:hypothetical protein